MCSMRSGARSGCAARLDHRREQPSRRSCVHCGCRDQGPPLTSHITALATGCEPPPRSRGDRGPARRKLRRVLRRDARSRTRVGRPNASAGDHGDPIGGGRISTARAATGSRCSTAGRSRTPARSRGRAACSSRAASPLPEARGRGAYRALVRARWDEAVRRGTPSLVVHAEEASRRVLERIGFEYVGNVVGAASADAVALLTPWPDDLRRFAEDPPAWGEIDPRSGLTRVLTDRYCLLFGSSPTTTLVSPPSARPRRGAGDDSRGSRGDRAARAPRGDLARRQLGDARRSRRPARRSRIRPVPTSRATSLISRRWC